MEYTAIDVVLLPSEEVAQQAITLSQALPHSKFSLNKESPIPHISLCFGVVENSQLAIVQTILKAIAKDFLPLEVIIEGVKVDTIATNEQVSMFEVTKTKALVDLHVAVMEKLKPYLSYDVDASMLYKPDDIEDITFSWIIGYGKKHGHPELYHPHITLGTGEITQSVAPNKFNSETLALCQLGNYCTCGKVLAKFTPSA